MIGLMYRQGIGKNQCMLFIFNNEGRQAIWMHNMQFAIDLIWLDRNSKIVDMAESMQPCASILNCREHLPKKDAKYVIEFADGTIKRNRITYKSKINIR